MHVAVAVIALRAWRRRLCTRGLAVLAAAASLACALPSAAAHAEGSQPIRQALSVLNPGGRAAQLVRRGTPQQLAAALKTTPAELTTQIQTQLGGGGGEGGTRGTPPPPPAARRGTHPGAPAPRAGAGSHT